MYVAVVGNGGGGMSSFEPTCILSPSRLFYFAPFPTLLLDRSQIVSSIMSLCAVRCTCGREIQSAYTRFRQLQKQGVSTRESLDQCGLPTCSPFGTVEDSKVAPTPPPVCCRGTLLATVDLTARHNVLQRIVRWAEGPHASSTTNPNSSAPQPTATAAPPPPKPFQH
jgi:DNA-directed RNA polymerase subunit N (RpoN/RPB10)